MSIWTALYSGVSGLNVHGQGLAITGDNIANVNTVGFKRARGVFGDMLATFLPTTRGAAQMGKGVMLLGIEQEFVQGAALNTENPLDLAVVGNGFFTVRGVHSGVNGNFYTRAGNFHLDQEGFLVNAEALRVQGFATVPNGQISVGRSLGDLRLGGITVPPEQTSSITITGALNPQDTLNPVFDVLDPDGTATFTTTLTIYDSLGQPHQVEVHANRTAAQTWEWHVLGRSDEITGAVGELTEIADGTLTFDAQGRLVQETTNANSVDFIGAAANQVINYDFGDSLNDGGTGLLGSTQFSTQSSAIVFQDQDGSPTGVLQALIVDTEGTIKGSFTNGETKTLGQVAIGNFVNPRGLDRLGGNLWAATPESGDAAIGIANTDGRGAILSQTLEQSNVDMAREFVDLIRTQRAYQASSKTITTADTLMETVIGLKR